MSILYAAPDLRTLVNSVNVKNRIINNDINLQRNLNGIHEIPANSGNIPYNNNADVIVVPSTRVTDINPNTQHTLFIPQSVKLTQRKIEMEEKNAAIIDTIADDILLNDELLIREQHQSFLTALQLYKSLNYDEGKIQVIEDFFKSSTNENRNLKLNTIGDILLYEQNTKCNFEDLMTYYLASGLEKRTIRKPPHYLRIIEIMQNTKSKVKKHVYDEQERIEVVESEIIPLMEIPLDNNLKQIILKTDDDEDSEDGDELEFVDTDTSFANLQTSTPSISRRTLTPGIPYSIPLTPDESRITDFYTILQINSVATAATIASGAYGLYTDKLRSRDKQIIKQQTQTKHKERKLSI